MGNASRRADQNPSAPSPIASFRILVQAAPLEIGQHLAPALGAFAEAVGHGQKLLAAVFVGTDDHQNTVFVGDLIHWIKS
jgi:hypothetical protein